MDRIVTRTVQTQVAYIGFELSIVPHKYPFEERAITIVYRVELL
jgi:hypothetical protein